MTAYVRTEEVWKTYRRPTGERVDAIKGVTIELEEGAFTAIIGPSGSGKTTLLNLIGLVSTPNKGRIIIDDVDLTNTSDIYRMRVRREKIGYAFQSQYLIPHLTAVENAALPKLCTDTTRAQAERMAIEILTKLDLRDRLEFRVAELSMGEQYRVNIARALINRPKLFIADEPTSAMDRTMAEKLMSLLVEMCKKDHVTVVVASHDPIVLNSAERIFELRDGMLVSENKD